MRECRHKAGNVIITSAASKGLSLSALFQRLLPQKLLLRKGECSKMNVSNIQEATIMAKTSEEKLKQIKELQAKKDAIMLRPDLEEGRLIRDTAKADGKTVSGYILEAVKEYMARHSGNNDAQAAVDTSAECVVEISQEMYTKAQMSANYHKMSMREFVEMSIAEQRMRDLRGVQASGTDKK